MKHQTLWLTCGVLSRELSHLLQDKKIDGKLIALDSMLHMDPPKLESILQQYLARQGTQEGRMVLVYGDCCPRMLNLVRNYKVGHVHAINCAQMLVGRTRYRELMKEQAFMFLPEWAMRWKDVFREELGLTHEVAQALMQDNRGCLVYLNTGLLPIPYIELEECSEYTGLPIRIESVTLDILLEALLVAEAEAPIHEAR